MAWHGFSGNAICGEESSSVHNNAHRMLAQMRGMFKSVWGQDLYVTSFNWYAMRSLHIVYWLIDDIYKSVTSFNWYAMRALHIVYWLMDDIYKSVVLMFSGTTKCRAVACTVVESCYCTWRQTLQPRSPCHRGIHFLLIGGARKVTTDLSKRGRDAKPITINLVLFELLLCCDLGGNFAVG